MGSLLDTTIEQYRRIGIAGHVRPDGDCIGSCLGVWNYIRAKWPDKEPVVFLEEIPHIFDFLSGADLIRRPGTEEAPFDLFIVLDCGDEGRLGKSAAYFREAGHSLCIDHHVTNNSFAEFNHIEPDASSASELVFLQMDRQYVTEKIAECLYTGIVTDTGVFQYSCTSSRTMQVAGVLMDLGIDYPAIVDHVFNEKTYDQNRIMGYAVMKSELYCNGGMIASFVTSEEMQRFHVLPKHMEGIVSQLRVTKGVEVALFLYQSPDGSFKGSLRSKAGINVADISLRYGGGGHARAAGFTWNGAPEDVIRKIAETVGGLLQTS